MSKPDFVDEAAALVALIDHMGIDSSYVRVEETLRSIWNAALEEARGECIRMADPLNGTWSKMTFDLYGQRNAAAKKIADAIAALKEAP